jgi:hypothetical protein
MQQIVVPVPYRQYDADRDLFGNSFIKVGTGDPCRLIPSLAKQAATSTLQENGSTTGVSLERRNICVIRWFVTTRRENRLYRITVRQNLRSPQSPSMRKPPALLLRSTNRIKSHPDMPSASLMLHFQAETRLLSAEAPRQRPVAVCYALIQLTAT